jgi:hypothetical protein
MGEARSTIESKAPGVSPKTKIQEALDQVQDLLQVKKKDLVDEGLENASKNRGSIAKLETAAFHLQSAIKTLDLY